jgi:phage terminase small subunit
MTTQKLTRKQKAFCDNYITNGYNGAKAARDAGYSKKCDHEIAAQNLAKVSIKEYVDNAMKTAEETHGLKMEEIFAALKRGVEYSMPDLSLAEDEEEREEMLKLYSINDGVKCISEHCKITGKYAAEKKEVVVDTSHMQDKLAEIENEFEKEY